MSATAVSGRRATPRRKRIATVAATAAAVALAGGTMFTVSAYADDMHTQPSGGNWSTALTTAPSVSATTPAASATASASTSSPVWAASQSAATAAKAKAAAQAKVQAAAAAKAKAEAAAKAKTEAASRATERAKLAAAKAAASAKAYVTPVADPTISESFGVPGSWAAGYHTGTDFAVNVGTKVRAVTSGTVVSAGWQTAYGNTVVVKLSDGKYALYAHLSHIGVSAGRHVAKGAQLGLSGNTGNSTGPHLHFEIRTSNTYGAVVNPVTYLKQHGVSL